MARQIGSRGIAFASPVLAFLFLSTFTVEPAHGAPAAGALQLGGGTPCEPGWLPTFGGLDGMDDRVLALAMYDDGSGSGPALYAGGTFHGAGGSSSSPYIAKWDGTSWSPLGSGVSGGGFFTRVTAMVVHDDGSGGGPALFVGGRFTSAGGVPASMVAKWDGSSWSSLGNGLNSDVNALAVFDDGSGNGPALYAGGSFTFTGSLSRNRIARWDGTSWKALGAGMNNTVWALAVYDDGTGGGPALHAAGSFTSAWGVAANRIAKWTGGGWSPLGSGFDLDVLSLAVFDDGTGGGPALFAGGHFNSAGGVPASRIAKWDGTVWSAAAGTMSSTVNALTVHDDGAGSGPALYAGGYFTVAGGGRASRIARWDGGSWQGLSAGMDAAVWTLAALDDGSGSGTVLHAGGDFTTAGASAANRIARWDGSAWSPVQGSTPPPDITEEVWALVEYDDGTGAGPALYAGGNFTNAGGNPASHVARWDGASWSALGGGVDGPVLALAVHDDGTGGGPALYVGGGFTQAGGIAASRIARWDGSSWSRLGNGSSHYVNALATYDDGSGSGPALYAAGTFDLGGPGSFGIAKWNGITWSAVGQGPHSVLALAVYDDGTGPALFAGGSFALFTPALTYNIAKWDGAAWSALGSGIEDGLVRALAVHDEGLGAGPALYVGGPFMSVGGLTMNGTARWDGSAWSQLGSGAYGVRDFAVYDDGSGGVPALYAGGSFITAGGVPASGIAKWDGTSWSPLSSGMSGGQATVWALAVHDDGTGVGPTLFAAGSFANSPAGDTNIARWGGCVPPEPGAAYCFGDGTGTACPCGNAGASGAGCANSSGVGARLRAQGSASVAADDLAFTSDGLSPNQPALLFAGLDALNGGAGAVLGDGLLCVASGIQRLDVAFASASGTAAWGPGLVAAGGWSPGDTRRFQLWYRDATGPCASGFNLSNAYELSFGP